MVLLSFRFPHHGKYSSYHRLISYGLNTDVSVDATVCKEIYYSRGLNWRGLATSTWRKIKEAQAWRIARSKGEIWVHYLYPEHGYFRGGDLKKSGQKILFSCHLPEEVLAISKDKLAPFFEGLKKADGIILMSPGDQDYYAGLAPDARIAFIPHGVDVHYFKPAESSDRSKKDSLDVLVVGNMMRDFDRLAKIIRLASEENAPLRFTVVSLESNLQQLKEKTGEDAWRIVTPLSGIEDNALLRIYQSSDLLFLPLTAATANNALLEAMATGLPMLVSDLPGCRAYAKDCALYFSKEATDSALVEQMSDFVRDPGSLRELGHRARELAVRELAWEAVAARQRSFMQAISEGEEWADV